MPDPLPSGVPPDLTHILARLRALLVHSCGNQLGRVLVAVTYEVSREGLCWTLPGNGPPWPPEMVGLRPQASLPVLDPAAASGLCPTPPLSEDDLAVLGVLLREPHLLAKHVATRLRVPNNATLRSRLANLKRVGLVSNAGRGYALTEAGERAVGAANQAAEGT